MQDSNLMISREENELRKDTKKKSWPLQIPAAVSACLVRLGYGTVSFWTSPAVPHLISNQSRFTITNDEASWIIALNTLGAIIGLFLYPLFINRIGRKNTLLLFAIPQVFSWLLIYYATNVHHLYFSRIFSGVGYNAGFIVDVIYVGEIAEKKIRGFLIALGKINYALGSLIVVSLGALVSYDNMNLILMLISLIFVCTFPFMPESPYFYLMIDREEDAFQSLAKLRGNRDTKALQSEIDSMKCGMRHKCSETYSLKKLLVMKNNRRALVISILASLSVAFSGTYTVAANLQTIVSYGEIHLNPEYSTMIIMSAMLILNMLIAPTPDWLGRRFLTLGYGIFTALGSATVGVFFFCKYFLKTENLSSISWLLLVALAIYMAGSNPGLFCISNILMAEVFSLEAKSLATAMINIISLSLDFLLRLCFERLFAIFGIYGVFWIFSVFSFATTLSNFIIMPETKGKTLEEIQEILKKM